MNEGKRQGGSVSKESERRRERAGTKAIHMQF